MTQSQSALPTVIKFKHEALSKLITETSQKNIINYVQ